MMAHILMLHSMLGLRNVERELAAEWERAGHTVTLPDLFDGDTADDYEEGFGLFKRYGMTSALERAGHAVATCPAETILAGASMGAMLVGRIWAQRPLAAGVLLISGTADWADGLRPGLPVYVHAGRPDPFDSDEDYANWENTNPGVSLRIYRYENTRHYFLDRALPDYDARSAALCRSRCLAQIKEVSDREGINARLE